MKKRKKVHRDSLYPQPKTLTKRKKETKIRVLRIPK